MLSTVIPETVEKESTTGVALQVANGREDGGSNVLCRTEEHVQSLRNETEPWDI